MSAKRIVEHALRSLTEAQTIEFDYLEADLLRRYVEIPAIAQRSAFIMNRNSLLLTHQKGDPCWREITSSWTQVLAPPRMFECSASLLLHLKAAGAVVDREKHFLPRNLDAREERLTVW